jgi:hypothetical protein
MTNEDFKAIDRDIKERTQKQVHSLLRSIGRLGDVGQSAAKVALQLRKHLRTCEKDGLIYYGLGFWYLTQAGRDLLSRP